MKLNAGDFVFGGFRINYLNIVEVGPIRTPIVIATDVTSAVYYGAEHRTFGGGFGLGFGLGFVLVLSCFIPS